MRILANHIHYFHPLTAHTGQFGNLMESFPHWKLTVVWDTYSFRYAYSSSKTLPWADDDPFFSWIHFCGHVDHPMTTHVCLYYNYKCGAPGGTLARLVKKRWRAQPLPWVPAVKREILDEDWQERTVLRELLAEREVLSNPKSFVEPCELF